MSAAATMFSVEQGDDGIAIIRIDVPNERHNILKAVFIDEAHQVLNKLAKQSGLKGVILTSAKADSFIAGADIHMLADCQEAADASQLARAGQAFCNRIAKFKKPVIAAIDGVCLGGGLELALACRARVCTDNDHTRLGLPEVQLGLLPGSGGTQRLPRLIGVRNALDLMLTGRQLRPHQAKRLGLVDEVVADSILLDVARRLIAHPPKRKRHWRDPRIISRWALKHIGKIRHWLFGQARTRTLKKTKGLYPAPERIIDCVETGIHKGLKVGLDSEARLFGELAMTAQARQLMQIYFATTELKKDRGTEAGVAPHPVRKIGVLGAGLMGAGISYVSSSRAAVAVRLKDKDSTGLNRGLAYIHKLIQQRLQRRALSTYDAQQHSRRVTPTLDYSGFHDADLVIEAVFEDLNLKQQMLREIEEQCRKDTLFASNTSSIPIAKIAQAAARPGNVIGMHYFSPVEKMPLLEVISGPDTDPIAIATAVEFGHQQGKTVIVVKDGAGFYVNRILAPYVNEAAHLLEEGIAIDAVDKALVDFGFPVGPFALLDEVGLDVSSKVGPILFDAFGERLRPSRAAEVLIKDQRLGKKSGRGFYRYGSGKKAQKEVDESVYKRLGVKADKPLVAEHIVERCVFPLLNEAVRCWEERVINSLRDGDIGAVFGIGFPPYLGGPFRYLDTLGAEHVVSKLQTYQNKVGARYAPAPLLEKMVEENDVFYPEPL